MTEKSDSTDDWYVHSFLILWSFPIHVVSSGGQALSTEDEAYSLRVSPFRGFF